LPGIPGQLVERGFPVIGLGLATNVQTMPGISIIKKRTVGMRRQRFMVFIQRLWVIGLIKP
jgi:hypothetical protein